MKMTLQMIDALKASMGHTKEPCPTCAKCTHSQTKDNMGGGHSRYCTLNPAFEFMVYDNERCSFFKAK